MKYLFIISIFLFQAKDIKSQTKDSIIYILSDSVEIVLNTVVNKGQNFDFYFILGRNKESYEITPCKYNSKSKHNIPKWVKITNRFLLINNKLYPLIFDYDLYFGAVSEQHLGEYSKRDEKVKRVTILSHTSPIKFTFKQ